jgi:hypothetical protein
MSLIKKEFDIGQQRVAMEFLQKATDGFVKIAVKNEGKSCILYEFYGAIIKVAPLMKFLTSFFALSCGVFLHAYYVSWYF